MCTVVLAFAIRFGNQSSDSRATPHKTLPADSVLAHDTMNYKQHAAYMESVFLPKVRVAIRTLDSAKSAKLSFDSMDHEQRIEFMKTIVLPKMRTVFASFDSVKFPKINCMTCHGDGSKDGTFTMPNPKLIKMPKNTEGFVELRQKHPDLMRFMMTTVKPTMAKLLGKPEFNMQTHTGFGCGNCHTSE